jgi:hypothetical protein
MTLNLEEPTFNISLYTNLFLLNRANARHSMDITHFIWMLYRFILAPHMFWGV